MQPAPPDASGPSPRRRPRNASSPVSGGSNNDSNSKRPRYLAGKDAAAQQAMASSSAGRPGPPKGLVGPSSAFQPYNGAKRLVIKNLRPPTEAADRNAQIQKHYERTHSELGEALVAILTGGKPAVPLERLYRGVEDLCRRGEGSRVHRTLRGSLEHHVTNVLQPRIQKAGSGSNIEMTKQLLAEWQAWNAQMILIRSTFSFLDRAYLLREKYASINDMTITYFRKMAFPDADDAFATSMGRSTVAAICELVQSDRRREPYDAGLLRGCLRMLHVLNVYVKRFEPVFLQESEPYFSEFAESHSTSSLKEYINACKGLLGREEFRCLEFVMELTTQRQLMQSAHHFLIVKYTSKLLDADNLSKLLESVDIVSVSNLYDLLRLSNIHEELRQPWGDYIRGAVARIIGDRERGDEMVIRLLELRRALDLLLRDALMDDDRLLYAMREAFSSVMNDRQAARCWNNGKDKIGEMIAKYMDMLLRGGLKALPASLLTNSRDRPVLGREDQDGMGNDDAELDLQLDHALEMFRFVEGKDTFENFYKRDLARRLLMGRSASQDAERSMLAKLRSECGSNFTHNLEQMFKDQELAKDEMQAYREWNAGAGRSSAPRNGSPTVDLQVMILSAASWPTYPDVQLNLPDGVAAETERFDAFYKNKHTGRVLSWKHSLAHCSLKAKFAKGTKELLVSAYQAVVLLLFNSVPAPGSADDAEAFLTYDQIAKATGLGGTDLDRTLQSLACGKSRVLSKHPKGRDINRETDTFSFNKAFTDPKFRIKINQIQHKETKEENKATHERIAQDRRFETQAAIVRIMKSRKKMSHPELQAEVINMTKSRGSVEPAAIKKEIESLIEKDYLEREGNSYVYLA